MTISIKLPDAFTAFRTEADGGEYGSQNDGCWDVVGEPLNKPVQTTVPEYYEKLELGDTKIAITKRREILDLNWGRIEQDAAALRGLSQALANLSAVIAENVRLVGEQWSGESYDKFAVAMGNIRTTLDAYNTAAKKVGEVLAAAMTQARSMYEEYAKTTEKDLAFTNLPEPGEWQKMSQNTSVEMAIKCPSGPFTCQKLDEQAVGKINGKFATNRQIDIRANDPCEGNLERVLTMFDFLVKDGEKARQEVRSRVETWCAFTDTFKESIRKVLTVAVGNVYELAESKAFTTLHVVGGGGGGGQPTGGDSGAPSGGYPGGGDPGEGSAQPIVDPSSSVEPQPEPELPAEPEAVAQPEDTASEAVTDSPQAADPGTVTITDGDRTIGVSNPGGDGQVKVTVTGADGVTKAYELDFDAASGLGSAPGDEQAASADGVERVPALSNGQCVIRDGDVTITAERSLFAPDQVGITVDDGTGGVNRYTVDFPDPQEPVADQLDQPIEAAEPAADTQADAQADTMQQPETQADAIEQPAAEEPASDASAPATPVTQQTSPQAWDADARGSVSGVLEPEQPDGEAGLAAAPDADQPSNDTQDDGATGIAGAGLPMSGATAGSSPDGGRSGSGWSVHGDLFDTGEPVYSMHGVLGDDDAEKSDG